MKSNSDETESAKDKHADVISNFCLFDRIFVVVIHIDILKIIILIERRANDRPHKEGRRGSSCRDHNILAERSDVSQP